MHGIRGYVVMQLSAPGTEHGAREGGCVRCTRQWCDTSGNLSRCHAAPRGSSASPENVTKVRITPGSDMVASWMMQEAGVIFCCRNGAGFGGHTVRGRLGCVFSSLRCNTWGHVAPGGCDRCMHHHVCTRSMRRCHRRCVSSLSGPRIVARCLPQNVDRTEAHDTFQLRRRPDTLDGPYARSARGVGKQAGDT